MKPYNKMTPSGLPVAMPENFSERRLGPPGSYPPPGMAEDHADPGDYYGRRGMNKPPARIAASRNTAFTQYPQLGEVDEDDIYALITNPSHENIMQFDANYGQGSHRSILDADERGHDWGIEDQYAMRGPYSEKYLGQNGRIAPPPAPESPPPQRSANPAAPPPAGQKQRMTPPLGNMLAPPRR